MKVVSIIFFSAFAFISEAQQNNFTLLFYENLKLESLLIQNDTFLHTSLKPLARNLVPRNYYSYGSKRGERNDSLELPEKKQSFLRRKLFTEHLIEVTHGNFKLNISPVLHFEYGRDTTGRLSVNSRGVYIAGDLSRKFSFTTGVVENQSFFEAYLSQYAAKKSVVPGQGRVRRFKETGFDYSYSFGNISWSPSDKFNFQAGHGKHFIGNGYRSMLLSDYAFYYPYVRSSFTKNRLRYEVIFAAFQEVKPADTRTLALQRKYASLSYLSFIPAKNIEIGFFESATFGARDTAEGNTFSYNYFNPVFGTKILSYGFRHRNNVIAGLNLKIVLFRTVITYGQLVVDDYRRPGDNGNFNSKYGYQSGVKYHKTFRNSDISFLYEYNRARPFTYGPVSSGINYTAYNEPLAHPAGANFRERIILCRYSFRNYFISIKYSHLLYGNDIEGVATPHDIFHAPLYNPDYNYSFITGVPVKTENYFAEAGMIINRRNNLRISTGLHLRKQTGNKDTVFIYFSLSTPLTNLYYDF